MGYCFIADFDGLRRDDEGHSAEGWKDIGIGAMFSVIRVACVRSAALPLVGTRSGTDFRSMYVCTRSQNGSLVIKVTLFVRRTSHRWRQYGQQV